MFAEAESIPAGGRVQADVCIVGAGPAGLTVASELAGSGMRVLLLESGGARPDARSRELGEGRNVGRSYYILRDARERAVGGTSHIWSGHGPRIRPLDPADFAPRPSSPWTGWPFDAAHLEPFYRRAHEVMGLDALSFDEYTGATTDPAGMGSLALTGFETTLTRFAPRDCFRRHAEALEQRDDVSVLLHATAVDLETDAGARRVTAVRAASSRTHHFSIAAGLVVLAGGGIDNAHLLLLADGGRGLGNAHDLVGRFFQEHLGVRVAAIDAPDARLLEGVTAFRRNAGAGAQQFLAASPALQREKDVLTAAFLLDRVPAVMVTPAARALAFLKAAAVLRPFPAGVPRHLATVVRNPRDAADALRASRSAGDDGDVVQVTIQSEQEPNPDSRVLLDQRRDRLGRRLPKLDWRVTARDLETIRRLTDALVTELDAHGLGRARWLFDPLSSPDLLVPHWHHMGTTRMHPDPRRGVVDPDGRVHGMDNLYVTGSSVFPTSGWVNPTLTLVALALRLGRHLKTT